MTKLSSVDHTFLLIFIHQIIPLKNRYRLALSQGRLFQGKGDWDVTPTPGQDEIRGNTLTGILATVKSSAELRNALITGNNEHGIWISTQSTLRIYGSTVSNNTEGIRLDTGSGISFWHPTSESTVTLTNNSSWGLNCFGDESSYGGSADSPNISGNGQGGNSKYQSQLYWLLTRRHIQALQHLICTWKILGIFKGCKFRK